MLRVQRSGFVFLLVILATSLVWSQDAPAPHVGQLTIDRLFSGSEFQEERVGLWVWSQRSPSYFTFQAAKNSKEGRDLVRNDCQSGAQTVVAESSLFIPKGEAKPLTVDAFEFSTDETKLLIYTNSQRVWRRNTRGDYWVRDLTSRVLQTIGGDTASATLMFAKFSPDGRSVAYVRENNLYMQRLDTMAISQLTHDGSATRINGTSDWVNEEELDIRDGYRWSPDSQAIAFWQFDTSGVPEFTMIDNTSEKYSRPIQAAYPKVEQQNSSARVRVVTLGGAKIQWVTLAGYPREHYTAHVE